MTQLRRPFLVHPVRGVSQFKVGVIRPRRLVVHVHALVRNTLRVASPIHSNRPPVNYLHVLVTHAPSFVMSRTHADQAFAFVTFEFLNYLSRDARTGGT